MTPYRDDLDALKARHASLSEELRAVRDKTRELEGLQDTQARLERELADLTCKIDTLGTRRSLPLLDNLRIASPCNADWAGMTGDERVRHCAQCDKDVYNLSEMTAEDAEALLREKNGNLCARLYRRADGTVITADCPVGLRKKRVRTVALAAAVGGGLLAGAYNTVFVTMGEPAPHPEMVEVMGEVAPVPVAAPDKAPSHPDDAAHPNDAAHPHDAARPPAKPTFR